MAHIDRQPSDEVFNDLKQAAIKVWERYDDTYGYATEKITRVNSIENYADNWWTFLGMMDDNNQVKLIDELELNNSKTFLNEQSIHYSATLRYAGASIDEEN